jgi:hypothetical protein
MKDYYSGKLLSRHNSSSHLYPVTNTTTTYAASLLTTFPPDPWHDRLGHPGLHILDLLRSSHFIHIIRQTIWLFAILANYLNINAYHFMLLCQIHLCHLIFYIVTYGHHPF